jgi:serine/threonine-protein kinase RsbW
LSNGSWSLRRDITSDPCAGATVIRELIERLEAERWNESDIFAIHLAVEEALANAIHHGNCCDPHKSVGVVFRTTPQSFLAEITDQGTGFDHSCLADPTALENIDRPCGRGVMLMRLYMDYVIFNHSGTTVEMCKHRESTPESNGRGVAPAAESDRSGI